MDLSFITATVFSLSSVAVFMTSFLVCLIIVATERLHRGRSAREEHLSAVQALHKFPVPRIGGLAVLAGLMVATLTGPYGFQGLLHLAVIAAPMLVLGLDEDMGRGASPRERLLGVALSTAIAMAVLGVWITDADLAGLDWALASTPVAIAFTLLLVVGTSHAFNIIDGLNGLSVGFASLAALSLAIFALRSGDFGLAGLVLLTLPAFLGFLAWNFPFGRLFLGDAGAYATGFLMVWVGIVLVQRHQDLSPWAVFLVFLWPIAETLFSMARRVVRRISVSTPDAGHVHHLLYRALCARWPGLRCEIANPIAAVLVLLPASVPMVVGLMQPQTAGPGEVALLLALFGLFAMVLQNVVTAWEKKVSAMSKTTVQEGRP